MFRIATFIKAFFLLLLTLSTNQLLAYVQQETEVAIVGAGMSGLTTAMRLQDAGVDYHVYEAKDQAGGRTYSVTGQDGTIYNMGGEWIDKEHKAMYELAKTLGVDLQKETYDLPTHVVFPEGAINDKQKVSMLQSIGAKLSEVAELLNTGEISPYREGELKMKSLNDILPVNLTEQERTFIKTYVETEVGSSISEMSLYEIHSLVSDLKGFEGLFEFKTSWWKPKAVLNLVEYQHRVVGGMSTMIDAFMNRLEEGRVRLGHILERVTRDEEGRYHLFFNDGGEGLEVIARSIVMTIPFSVLRNIPLDATLGLTEVALSAIQNLRYGTNSKVQVPFAVDSRPEDYRFYVDGRNESIVWNPVSGKSGATIYLGGEQGENLDEARAAELVAETLPMLGVEQGGDFMIKNWAQDPYALGSYASTSKDDVFANYAFSAQHEGMRQFAEPTDGFIFAGEHTRVDSGYMNSAVESGNFAADYYLNTLQDDGAGASGS